MAQVTQRKHRLTRTRVLDGQQVRDFHQGQGCKKLLDQDTISQRTGKYFVPVTLLGRSPHLVDLLPLRVRRLRIGLQHSLQTLTVPSRGDKV